jgi:ribonuclease VapC
LIAIDTSAVICILLKESDSTVFASIIRRNKCVIGTPTLVECKAVAFGRIGMGGMAFVDGLIATYDIEILDFRSADVSAASHARVMFGKGSGHPAQLNLGDTFSYALAKTRKIPLLFKGNDFIHTDIISAIPQAAP